VFERFTPTAREVVVLAQDESRALRHDYIGAEHLLLGLLRVGGPASFALQSMGVTVKATRSRIIAAVGAAEAPRSGQIPFTPRAKLVLERSLREALSLGHDHIGDEHLLLGLLRQTDGLAVEVLSEFGVDRDELGRQVLEAAEQGQGVRRPGAAAGLALSFSEPAMEVLNRAMELARNQGEAQVSPDHLREALGREGETDS